MLEQGPTEQRILQAAYRAGREPPPRIANAPELLEGLELYWQAYLDLSTDRNMNGRVPWSSVLRWAELHELSYDQFTSLTYYISKLDDVCLEHQEKNSGK